MGEILKLKYIAEEIQAEVKNKIETLGANVKLACVVVGEDPASESYIRGIVKNSEKLGMSCEVVRLPEEITEVELGQEFIRLNKDDSYSGIILQMPLPDHLDRYALSGMIDYRKDVDGVSPFNQGLLFSGKPFLLPATAWAVDHTLSKLAVEKSVNLAGKRVAIVGRSVTVGKPALHLLLKRNMTPTMIHTKTTDAQTLCQDADVVVACCGVAEMLDSSWVADDAMVIDVGINSKVSAMGDFKLCGDVNAPDVANVASVVTAVPGGIGAVTSALLFANCFKAWHFINRGESIRFNFEV